MAILQKFVAEGLFTMRTAPGSWLWALAKRRLAALVEPRIVVPGGLQCVSVKRVVIVALGDDPRPALCATPLVQELERRFPRVGIHVLVTSHRAAEVFDGFESVRSVVVIPSRKRGVLAWICALTKLRVARYDLGIDLGDRHESGRAVLALANPGAPLFVPSADNDRWTYVMFSAPHDPARLPVYLLRRALVCEEQCDEIGYPPIALRLSCRESRNAAAVVRGLAGDSAGRPHRHAVGLLTNRSDRRILTPAWWERFIREFESLRPDCAVVEITGAGGRCLPDSVAHHVSSDLRSLVAVFTHLSGLVVADPELAHLASAGRTATVELHSIGDSFAYLACGPLCRAITVEPRSPESAARKCARALIASAAEVTLRESHSPPRENRGPDRRPTTISSRSRPEVRMPQHASMIGGEWLRWLLAGIFIAAFPVALQADARTRMRFPREFIRSAAPAPACRARPASVVASRRETSGDAQAAGEPWLR